MVVLLDWNLLIFYYGKANEVWGLTPEQRAIEEALVIDNRQFKSTKKNPTTLGPNQKRKIKQ